MGSVTASAPQSTKRWTVQGTTGFDSLRFDEVPVAKLGPTEVLVKFHYASLNYRDLIIPMGRYGFPQRDGVVPGSDGAGEVISVGPSVTRFKAGDKVLTLFNQGHLAGALDQDSIKTGTGGTIDGSLREYGSFDQQGLVHMPKNLDYQQGSTLSCAALTAWNALYGLESKAIKAGDVVLTQGTGGVSLFALQFAKAAGAKVIATTSSAEKTAVLKKLGADHVINYKEDTAWGETAQKLTSGRGVQHVVEVGGPKTMEQSLKAVGIDGTISIIGFIGGKAQEKEPSFLGALTNICTVRGLLVGSRAMMEDMCRAIEVNDIKPVVDEKVFGLEQLKEAYQYMWDQKHFGKLTIKIA